MARGFRQSSFRGRGSQGMGEDVNPQAYIVNLADCMLVLACGFMVMLVARYNLNITTDVEVQENQLEQIETEQSDSSMFEGGSSYVEAGTAYYDPTTGTYYIKEATDENGSTVTDTSSSSSSSSSSNSSSKTNTSANDTAIRNAKAAGAD